jgi:hypothetical protein
VAGPPTSPPWPTTLTKLPTGVAKPSLSLCARPPTRKSPVKGRLGPPRLAQAAASRPRRGRRAGRLLLP